MSVAAGMILTLIATLAAIAGSGIAWPGKVVQAGRWLQKLETRDEPGTDDETPQPQAPGCHAARHARSAPLRSSGRAATPAPPPGADAAPADASLSRAGRPPLEDRAAPEAKFAPRAPWSDVGEPVGWPVFATSTDLEPVDDGRVFPPYVLPEWPQ